jgi:hypothetical protein
MKENFKNEMFNKIAITTEEILKAKKEIKPIFVTDDSNFTRPIKIMGVGNYDYIDYATGETKNTSYKLFTLGNFSVIKGASKSQKTFLQTLLVSTYLNSNIENHNKLFNVYTNIAKKVIIFDTEQHVTDVVQVRQRINAMTNQKNDNLIICSLRELNYLEKIEAIEKEIEKHKNALIVIDGVKDLVRDLNDFAEASDIAEKLLRWSSKSNSHIITIIHTNVGTTKARGHIGSTLYEKCETLLDIEKIKGSEIRKVSCEMVRGSRQFEDFYFEVDKLTGLPYIVEMESQNFL